MILIWPKNIIDLPRFVINSSDQLEIHAFSDASNKAYTAAVYVLNIKKYGKNSTFLIYAKSRIAPIKQITVPRLELLSVLIGVRATQFVLKQLELKDVPVTLWSDSKCALFWIKNYSRLLPRFVQNRVEEIRKADFTFRYIPSAHNPVDVATRFHQVNSKTINHELHNAGIAHTLCELRQNFWIPKGRSTVKRVTNGCFAYRRWRTNPYKLPPMPNLPEKRVKRSKPFQQMDLDYMGPITVKDKFISRRGYPKLVLSEFKTIVEQNGNFLSLKGMVWKNIIPKAPWSGESKLNTCPLTYLNFDDYKIIKPIDFISPNVPLNIPSDNDSDQEEFILHTPNTRDKLINYWSNTLKTLFWEIWKNEYLIGLRERIQRELASPRLVDKYIPLAGEIVLLNEPDLLRGMWKLVKKIETLKLYSDGV
uniref:DUF5641 domain-containing protein n=1 Tax=Wuchereria bancrofti TaxID=6293 RepID=A0AAF5Q4M9_WUCBA